MADGDIFSRIMAAYPSLTKSETKIADFILANRTDALNMYISELASYCKVGDATLTRFCRDIGCSGFNDFKLALAQSAIPRESVPAYVYYNDVQAGDSLTEKCHKLCQRSVEALQQTLGMMDFDAMAKAVELLLRANRVYCFGQGSSSILAMECWGRFAMVTNKFQWIQDSHMQAMTAALMAQDDVIVYFSYSGATQDLAELMAFKKTHPMQVILITRFIDSPGARSATLVLPCGANESPLQQGSVAAKVAQLYVIDVLFNEYCSKDELQTISARAETSAAIAMKML